MRCSPFFGRPNQSCWLGITVFSPLTLANSISSVEGPFAGAQWQQTVVNSCESVLIGERMGNNDPNYGEACVHRRIELKTAVMDINVSRDGLLG